MLKEEIQNYQANIDKIFKAFGIENGYGEIDVRLDVKWNIDDECVRWVEKGDVYSNEVCHDPLYAENYMLVFVDNNCGEKYYQIFDTNLKDENIEEDFG